MTKVLKTFLVDPAHAKALAKLKTRDGIGLGEALRRALEAFLKRKHILPARPYTRRRRKARR